MANNKTTYTLEIDAELGSLQKKLGTIKNLMSGVLNSANAPKGLEKSFEKIEGILDKIANKASQPISSQAGFASIEKDIGGANAALASLLKIIGSINHMAEGAKISFLPPDEQAKINAVITSLSVYADAIAASTTETAELTQARKDLAKAEEAVVDAQSKLGRKTDQLEQAKAERDQAQSAIDSIKDRKKALNELYEEQKKIEKFYSTPLEDGSKKNRSKKYDGVSMRPQDIKKKIDALEQASAGDEEALKGYQEELKRTTNNVNSYIAQVATAERALNSSKQSYEELEEKVESLNNAFVSASAENQQQAFEGLREEAKKLGISLEGIEENFSEKDAEELVNRFVELKTKGLSQIPELASRARTGVLEMGEACGEVQGKVEGASVAYTELREAASQQKALEDKIKSFLGVAGAAQVMRAALRDAMSTITELDATMTEMAVVTDLTVGDYWDQLPEYSKRASELGVSINSAYKAATLYYQQGLKTNEVNAISTETLKMAKIAGLDAAEATNKMTAALRGFNMELNETSAQRVSDVYSELAAITAADVDEISTAMTKTASIASSAGMEFETTAAFLSQIIETTRESAETAGTAMKTVIARFQELKKAPNEIGEVDGEIVDANAIETALRSVGVSLRDAGGQFRELDDVFLELSSKWDGLDKNTQRYIATIAAGSRQQSRFIAMMQDYSRTQELVSSANNSAGASNRQFEKTMDSLEAKMEKLKNAWHEFSMGIMESDLVKIGVDILTKFLEVVNKATNGLDSIGNSITKIASVLVIFKTGSKIFEKFKPMIRNFLLDIVNEYRGAGFNAGKEFAEGVKAGTTNKPLTDHKPELTEKEREKREKNLQQVRAAARAQASTETRGVKDIPKAILSGVAKPIQSASGAVKGVAKKVTDRQQLKNKRDLLTEDIEEVKKTRDTLQGQAMVSNLSTSPQLIERIKKTEAELAEKEAQLQDINAQIESGTIGSKAKQAFDWGKQKFTGGHFDAASEKKKEMERLAWQMARKEQLGAESDNRQSRMAQLERDKTEAIRQEDIAKNKNFRARGTSGEKAAQEELLKRKKVLLEIEEEQKKLQKEEQEYQDLVAESNTTQEEFNKKSEEYLKEREEGWDTVGKNISKAGESVAGVGVAMSMLGGIFEELGLTELGEAFSTVGQYATMFGSALTMLGPAVATIGKLGTSVATKLQAAGWSTMAAWLWVALIAAAVIALVIAIAAIFKTIKENSPEEKLKKANEAAENAANAANEAADAYDRLAESFDSLGDKYKALDELTKGTKEWNDAVQDINSSVLDLISEYPELAKFVENKEGVLTIDLESAGVQDVLNQAEAKKVAAKNYSIITNTETQKAQDTTDFGKLEAVNKIAKQRGWQTFGQATGAGAIGGIGVGAVAGMIVGAIAGPIEASKTKTDQALQDAVGSLAESVANGAVGTDYDSMFSHLTNELGVAADEAKILAEEFSNDLNSLTTFGEALADTKLQQQAAYNAIAASAQSLANTLSMSEEEITRSNNLVSGDVAEEFYQDKLNTLEGINLKDQIKNNGEYKDDIENAIKKEYGDDATIDKDGKVVNKKGETLDTLDTDEVKRLIATQYATESSARAIEASDDAIATIGESFGNVKAIENLYNADEGGGLTQADVTALQDVLGEGFNATEWLEKTDAEKEAAAKDEENSIIPEEVQKAWNAMVENGSAIAYGNDITNFLDDLAEGVTIANEAFEDAKDSVRDFMTADMAKSFQNKLDEVAEKAGGADATEAVQKATDILLGAQTDENGDVVFGDNGKVVYKEAGTEGARTNEERTAIQARVNAADWSNLESLLALQIDLQTQYGYTKDEATEYIDTLKDSANASSSLTTAIDSFGKLYEATEKVARATEKLAAAQWELERALRGGGGSISNLVKEQISAVQSMSSGYKEQMDAAIVDMNKIYAQGMDTSKFGGYDLSDFTSLSETGELQLYNTETGLDINSLLKTNPALEEGIQEWIDNYNDKFDISQEALNGMRDSLDTLEELESQGKDAYYELRDMAKEAILASLQEQIDLQQETLDATRSANDQLINKLQEQINETRQDRQNAEARENIANLQSQAAYLAMDTSGANALSLVDTNTQIEQATQDYEDTLIDQTIQSLQDANEKAAEQRERQIAIAESQLALYESSAEFQTSIDSQLSEMLATESAWQESGLGELLIAKFTEGLSAAEQKDWEASVTGQVALADAWTTEDWTSVKNNINNMYKKMTEASPDTDDARSLALQNQTKALEDAGFTLSNAGVTRKVGEDGTVKVTGSGEEGKVTDSDTNALNNMSEFAGRDSDSSEIKKLQSSISTKQATAKSYGEEDQANNYTFKTQKQFYAEQSQNIAQTGKAKIGDKEYSSYTEYLESINSRELTGIENLSAMEAYGGGAISGEAWRGAEGAKLGMSWKTGANFNAKVNGIKDTEVHLGTTNVSETARLDYIWNNTGGSKDKPYVYLSDTDQLFIRQGAGSWWDVRNASNGEFPRGLRDSAKKELEAGSKIYKKPKTAEYSYKTGGLADFTGPAWLDGTPSKPEYVLNSTQTERFFSLIDVLEGYDTDKKSSNKGGDNYFDININVEKIEDDYDVEQMAEKIRRMIYDDATYRNVNSINHIR